MFISLGAELKEQSKANLNRLIDESIASRIFEKDSEIWGPDAQPEASIRLGWTDPIDTANELLPQIVKLRDEFHAKGITRIVLCGMGGSSLAPEVICKGDGVDLFVLDSTSPSMVRKALSGLEITAVVVSSKSGSTVETDSQKRIFEQAFEEAGIDPKLRMVIVTDPQSPLMLDSEKKGYTIFEADPNVGGRYSALTAFGFVPSGLAGANIAQLIADAKAI
ncbi:MAG TPA: glucose-6-phosphate isomerase, partial [Microbacteriaceae bacterium]